MAAVVSIFSLKGGVGKTITASALASFFSGRGVRVLLMDMCYNLNATLSMIDSSTTAFEDNLYDAVLCGRSLSIFSLREHMHLASCGRSFSMLESVDHRKVLIGLKAVLDSLADDYDIVFVDLPAVFSSAVSAVLQQSDRILVPTKADRFSFDTLDLTLTCLSKLGIFHLADVFFTMHDTRERNTVMYASRTREAFAERVMRSVVRRNVSLCESSACSMSIFEYRPSSAGAADYSSLADELYERIVNS